MSCSAPVGTALEGQGQPRRAAVSLNDVVDTPAQGVHTLYDVLQYSAQRRANHHGAAYREIEKVIEEEKEIKKVVDGVEQTQKKTWKFFQLSSYHFVSYADMSTIAHEVGQGLVAAGLTTKCMVSIFAPTSLDWMMFAHGAFTQNMTIVTAYDTLGADGLLHSMNETGVSAIFTSAELLPTVASVLPKCDNKPIVIYTGQAKTNEADNIRSSTGVDVYTLEELRLKGRQHPVSPVKPSRDDLCCIMYTSGSTGNPKGVVLKHSNLVGAIAGVDTLLRDFLREDDTIMAYLPLAHVLEFLVENLSIFWGITLGYGTVRTLTDMSVRNCKGDISEFRPSLLTGVPAVWETIRKGVLNNVAKMSPTTQAVFHRAVTLKGWLVDYGLPTGWLDSMVFSKIRDQVGGRLRLALSGGAPLAPETQRFLSTAMAPILGGYGMTESCGMCCIMAPDHFSIGPVGGPVPCCEIKLVDVPEANYLSTNQPKPQGEIWIRGSSICSGYWKMPELSQETITEDGWLRTGDVGEWNDDGSLSVVDRIKNLVKLNNGEYIALEKLESVYKTTLGVSNVCVYADSNCARPVALVVPVEAKLRKLATETGLDGSRSLSELCDEKKLREQVLKQMRAEATKAQLKPAEIIHDVYLCSEEWTSDNGMMTAAQKLRRHQINKQYETQLKEMNASQKT